jgi:hypothetical protein
MTSQSTLDSALRSIARLQLDIVQLQAEKRALELRLQCVPRSRSEYFAAELSALVPELAREDRHNRAERIVGLLRQHGVI